MEQIQRKMKGVWNKKKKVIPFDHLTGEYLTISQKRLKSVSILSSCVLNNVRFSTPWENEYVISEIIVTFKKKSGFTPCKTEQPLQGMELQEKEAQKD